MSREAGLGWAGLWGWVFRLLSCFGNWGLGAGAGAGAGLELGAGGLAWGRVGLEIDGLGVSTQATTSNFYVFLS